MTPPRSRRLVAVSGLPRAGSTLLCQLLGEHPRIESPPHSSPLCATLVGLRAQLSDSPFLLAQLDADYEGAYGRLLAGCRGFLHGWLGEGEADWVVDKNRGWVQHLELLQLLEPDCRVLVCVRELGQIFGSIEAQHARTRLLDFPDHLAALSRPDRARKLFADEGVVGSPLRSLEAVQDLEESLQQHLYYVVYEHLMSEPVEVMGGIFEWLDLEPFAIDPQNLRVQPHESDSHYRFKYPHATRTRIEPPERHAVPPRFEVVLRQNFGWYYDTFYPGLR